jgi:Raf kinase inhibitor-like YbhB/YbcL family protein
MKALGKYLILIFLILIFLTPFFFKRSKKEISFPKTLSKIMKISSPAFENNSKIPEKYTCDGENVNPPLKIEGVPKEAKSLVLIVDDPDAPMGTFLHWLVWNIPPETNFIEENSLPERAIQGKNDFGKENYGGPCPPFGTHRYFFKLYALDKILDLPPGSNLKEVEKAMDGHILDQDQLVGLYQRK